MAELIASPPQNRLLRGLEHALILICMLGFVATFMGIVSLLMNGNHAPGRDIIAFWTAGKQIAAHANPYDADQVLRIERAAGFSATAQALIMRNPPTALPLVLPLSPFGLEGASRLWSVLLIAAFALSVHLVWAAYGRPANKIHLAGYTFAPALTCIMGGQTGVFALLGLALFLRFYRERSFIAGMGLWLCALKPHLFLPFGVVVLVWVVVSRRYQVIAGAALALAASSALAMGLDPGVWTQYREMMHTPNIQAEFIPCLSYGLRMLHPQTAWLQYIPAAGGCVWAIWFYLSRRTTWNWIEDGALLMLVSLVVSPYAWITDHSILIPALLAGAYRTTSRMLLCTLALASLLIEIAQFTGKSMHYAPFMLVPPFWLVWYLFAIWSARPSPSQNNSAPHTALASA